MLRGRTDVARAVEIEQQKLEAAAKAWQEEKIQIQQLATDKQRLVEDEIKDLKREVSRLESTLAREKEDHRKTREQLVEDCNKAQSRLDTLAADADARRELSQRLVDAEIERDKALRYIGDLESKTRELEEDQVRTTEQLGGELSALRNEITELKDQKLALETNNASLTDEIRVLEVENARLEKLASNTDMTGYESRGLQTRLMEKTRRILALEQELATLTEENEDLMRTEVNVRNKLGLAATNDSDLLGAIDELMARAKQSNIDELNDSKRMQESILTLPARHSRVSCEHAQQYKRRLEASEKRVQRLESRMAERENKYYQLRSKFESLRTHNATSTRAEAELSRHREKLELVSLALKLWKRRYEDATDRAGGLRFLKTYYTLQIQAKESCNILYLNRLAGLGVYPNSDVGQSSRRPIDKLRAAMLAVRAVVRLNRTIGEKSRVADLKSRIAKVKNAQKRSYYEH
jgi:chromosome segregation ATPase